MATLVPVLSDTKFTALLTIISCPQGLRTKRITKNKNIRMPNSTRKVLRNQRNFRFFGI